MNKQYNENFGRATVKPRVPPATIPIAGDADNPPMETYTESDKHGNRKAPRQIEANALKGGSGAKWILHRKINALIQQNYTRKMICNELGICRMTLYRHQYLY